MAAWAQVVHLPEEEFAYDKQWLWSIHTKREVLFALRDLAAQGSCLASRWGDALYAWSFGKHVQRIWFYAAPRVQILPDVVLQAIAHSLTWWMEVASKSIKHHQHILLDLCRRVLALPLEAGSGSRILRNGVESYDPVESAINHPIGHVTQVLINLWFNATPNDNERLPDHLKAMFTALCDVQEERFRHGRVLLGSELLALFRVDRPWTE